MLLCHCPEQQIFGVQRSVPRARPPTRCNVPLMRFLDDLLWLHSPLSTNMSLGGRQGVKDTPSFFPDPMEENVTDEEIKMDRKEHFKNETKRKEHERKGATEHCSGCLCEEAAVANVPEAFGERAGPFTVSVKDLNSKEIVIEVALAKECGKFVVGRHAKIMGAFHTSDPDRKL